MKKIDTPHNYLTIDVEDYYQVSAFEDSIKQSSWSSLESRVLNNTNVVLDILDRFGVKATFFIVGWIAEQHPEIVKNILARQHEIGCHSYLHRRIYNLTPEEFKLDTSKAKDILEQISGQKVLSYRAPSYSITGKSLWALNILAELGFKYDSSIFPIRHDIYGIPDAPRYPFQWDLTGKQPQFPQPAIKRAKQQNSRLTGLFEFPISTAKILGRNIPAAGGGYFRLFPYWFTRYLLRKINVQEGKPFIFYIHPWEFDPDQPRIDNAKAFSKFRHYNNLNKTRTRLERLLADFKFGPMAAT